MRRSSFTSMDTQAHYTGQNSPTALVVDDEPLILLDTCDLIADEGYSVVEASSADEALLYLEASSSFQLIFTDVQMPGKLDGFELAALVAERWPHIRVIIASGAAIPARGDIPPLATFISKPFTAELIHKLLSVP